MFSHVRIIALAIAGAGLICFPAQARTVTSAAASRIALPNAPFSVLPAKGVIKRFKLVSLLSPLAQKEKDTVKDFMEVKDAIVFEGDVKLRENIHMPYGSANVVRSAFEQALIDGDRLIVIRGDLDCRKLDTSAMHGVFVLGNVTCDTVWLGMSHFYVKGNLVARTYLAGSADDDEGYGNEGETQVRVDGTVSSPKVRTWHFGLGHLKFAEGSAEEVRVEREDRDAAGPCSYKNDC